LNESIAHERVQKDQVGLGIHYHHYAALAIPIPYIHSRGLSIWMDSGTGTFKIVKLDELIVPGG
jgi:hypothetical protein